MSFRFQWGKIGKRNFLEAHGLNGARFQKSQEKRDEFPAGSGGSFREFGVKPLPLVLALHGRLLTGMGEERLAHLDEISARLCNHLPPNRQQRSPIEEGGGYTTLQFSC